MTDDIQAGIRVRAKELLGLGEVQCVIGYEMRPTVPGVTHSRDRVRPVFVFDPVDTDKLVWNSNCHHNLMVYLRDQTVPLRRADDPPRVAVVAKPCDVRALNVLIHEQQVVRDQVFVIGVACAGTMDPARAGGEGSESLAIHCQRCKERVPTIYDALVGEPQEMSLEPDTWSDVVELETMTAAERLAFWTQEFERCIRCYACRQACPGCYCFECLADQVDPPWLSIAHQLPEKAFFHIMRAYHLAGRCVECYACDHACPMNIPLSLLNRKIAKDLQTLFGFTAGGDPDNPPPLATFRKDEELPL